MPTIDKKIHFVWCGGDTMSDERLETVIQWRKQNPTYQVIIWADRMTTPQEQLDAFRQKVDPYKIDVKDITENGIQNKFIRHELDKIKPNYGKSSDLIRLAVLGREGGIYLDVDVLPGREPFPAEGIYAENGILFSPYTQRRAMIGNDILMATAHNEIMLRLEQDAYRSYGRNYTEWLNRFDIIVSGVTPDSNGYSFYEIHDRDILKNYTIDIAGPAFIRRALYEYGIIARGKAWQSQSGFNPAAMAAVSDYILKDNYFLSIPDTNANLKVATSEELLKEFFSKVATPPIYFAASGNTADWLKEKTEMSREKQTYDELLLKVIQSIFFEIENMGYLRVNGYIEDLAQYTRKSAEDIADDIYSALEAAIAENTDKQDLIKDLDAYELVPTMLNRQGEAFFQHHFADKKNGLYLLHINYYQCFRTTSQDEKISFLNKLSHLFRAEEVIGDESYLNRLHSMVNRNLSNNHTENFIIFAINEIKSLSLSSQEKQKMALSIFSTVLAKAPLADLTGLLKSMLTKAHPLNKYFLLLREEHGTLRGKYGNTKTWNSVTTDLKKQIVSNIANGTITLSQEEFTQLEKLFNVKTTDITRTDFFKESCSGASLHQLKKAGKIIINSSKLNLSSEHKHS